MTYTFEQLISDVKKEAEALRVHATSDERERLILKDMHPNHTYTCYYGLMTGHCDSPRATELIKKCTCVYIDGLPLELESATISQEFRAFRWSPIEYYIHYPDARNANLIAYLRGETETLDL